MGTKRQFTMQLPGTLMGNGTTDGPWSTVRPGSYGGPGVCYYCQTTLDLRGLLAGKQTGLQLDSLSLQEAVPWTTPALTAGSYMVFDMVTTVRPNEDVIGNLWQRPDTGQPNRVPGFLYPLNTPITEIGADYQSFNPSQVVWGLWRYWAMDPNWKVDPYSPLFRVAQSGYFGQGDMAVSPSLYWTRVVITNTVEDVIIPPSANLLCYGEGIDITAAQEMTGQMRAVQR